MSKIVTTKYGRVEGFESKGLLRFLGMPFARKLDDELKWKRAQECQPWDGVLKAHAYGDQAPQFAGRWDGSLDCLTLNIVRPLEGEKAIEEEKLPVFVWIHGGGYSVGGCHDTLAEGDEFAREGIVYVNIQYRLSVLGFYEFCTYLGCEGFETNRGLSDMIMALKWVHENIAAFGGDPENVTIAGESAGGAAVVALMAVPSVEGYFQKVIAESGLCNLVDSLQAQRRKTELFLEGMGWDPEDPELGAKIRAIDDHKLIEGHLYQESHMQYIHPGTLGLGPVIDDLLPMLPVDAMKAGASKNVKLIIGTNLHEGTMFLRPEGTIMPNTWEMVEECMKQNGLEDRYPEFEALYKGFEADGRYGSALVKFATDDGWEVPSIRFAEEHSKYNDTYMYRFEYLSKTSEKNGMLVAHAFELPCVFAVKDHPFAQMFFAEEKEADKNNLIDTIHGAWVEFVKKGKFENIQWPCYHEEPAPVMIFDHKCETKLLDRRELMQVWRDVVLYKD